VGIGGLLLGSISVISLGFAAVLLGLAVDYAVVHYQEALAHPQLSVPEIRRAISPSILWAAITTISAFLVLNLGGLPGLAQLGLLVAIGIALAALVMVVAFLPPLFPERRRPGMTLARHDWWSYLIPPGEQATHPLVAVEGSPNRAAFVVTGVIILCACAVLSVHRPGLDKTTAALRPQHGEAEQALAEVTASLGISQDSTWVIVSGSHEREVYQRLSAAEALLNQARSNQLISGYLLPTALWPRVEFQDANRETARFLGTQGSLLRDAALRAGFNTNALFLTDELVRTWARIGASPGVVWPTNQVSQWLLKQFVARTTNSWLVMGLVYPATNRLEAASLAGLSARLSEHGALLSGWELLGTTTLKRVQERLWRLVLPMIVLVLLSLWLAFRRSTEVLLGVAVLCLSGLCLLTTMALSGWSWNLLNLMALPLMLGTGVDYGIFMQLALRRNGGDVRLVRRSVGRALLLCGGTAIAGFGSLAWSGNAGMASLGKVCAVGIGANMLISVYLLPAWWARVNPKAECRRPKEGRAPKSEGGEERLRSGAEQSPIANRQSPILQSSDAKPATSQSSSSTPITFYHAGIWRLGLALVRVVPKPVLDRLFVLCAEIYYRYHRQSRETVVSNLLPVLSGDRAAAETKAHELFRQFGLKLADLWRYEAGVMVQNWSLEPGTWERIMAWQDKGRGILLVMAHLGNWEIGGPLLARRGIKLLVLTQAEPGSGLTELRMASRAKWGIETVVVGNDAFAFVEVIKRLQEGATVAVLVDRPSAPSAVRVNLFGRPFLASVAAAELARASGCVLARGYVLRRGDSYIARMFPEIEYDRRALNNREARRELTQQILRAFEPDIREHVDQWFHFVPIWPEDP
jgi:lauroyl/myristoyl acyltransferase